VPVHVLVYLVDQIVMNMMLYAMELEQMDNLVLMGQALLEQQDFLLVDVFVLLDMLGIIVRHHYLVYRVSKSV